MSFRELFAGAGASVDPSSFSKNWKRGWPNAPALPPFHCSPTPVPRASMPGLLATVITMTRTEKAIAMSA